MRVDRTPLVASSIPSTFTAGSAADPAAGIYQHSKDSSTTWNNVGGWLLNLASTMRAEQITYQLDRLHPTTNAPTQTNAADWSCPLRRLSFWTKVAGNFSPLAPSPARSARLFGNADRNMLHGTR